MNAVSTLGEVSPAEAAEIYAANGCRVFPTDRDTRKPKFSEWASRASCDRAKVAGWWSTWPTALISFPFWGTRIFAIDGDRHEGKADGVALLQQELIEHQVPISLWGDTAGGGVHVLMKLPEGAVLGNSSPWPSGVIDLRGPGDGVNGGGFIFLPGGVRADGKRWRVGGPAVAGMDERAALAVFARALAAGEGIPVVPSTLLEKIQGGRSGRRRGVQGAITGLDADGRASLLTEEEAGGDGFARGQESVIGRFYAEKHLAKFRSEAGPGAYNTPVNDLGFEMGAVIRLRRVTPEKAEELVLAALSAAGGGTPQHEETALRAIEDGIRGASDASGGGRTAEMIWGSPLRPPMAPSTQTPVTPVTKVTEQVAPSTQTSVTPSTQTPVEPVAEQVTETVSFDGWYPPAGLAGEENRMAHSYVWTQTQGRLNRSLVVAWQRGMENPSIETIVTGLCESFALVGRGGMLWAFTARDGEVELRDVTSAAGRQTLANLAHEKLEIWTTVLSYGGDCIGCWRGSQVEGVGWRAEINIGPPKRGKPLPEGAAVVDGNVWTPARLLSDVAPPDRRVRVAFYPDGVEVRHREGGFIPPILGREQEIIASGKGELVIATGRRTASDRDFVDQMKTAILRPTGGTIMFSGTLRAPALGREGRIVAGRGYDRQSGYWVQPDDYMPDGLEGMPMTRKAAMDAAEYLKSFFSGCYFADEIGLWASVGLVLAGVCRPAWGHCPAGFVVAPLAGTGKGTLVQMIVRMALGPSGRVSALPWSDATPEEVGKSFSTAMMKAPDCILIDNAPEDVPNIPVISSALTEDVLDLRRLGYSEDVTVDPRGILVLINGNNTSLASDWPRRIITISLVPPEGEIVEEPIPLGELTLDQMCAAAAGRIPTRRVERPVAVTRFETRPELMARIDAQRPRIATAAAVLLAWGVAMKADKSIRWPKPRDSFEDFSRLVRDPLWLLTGGEAGGVDILAMSETISLGDSGNAVDEKILGLLFEVETVLTAEAPGVREGFTLADVRQCYEKLTAPPVMTNGSLFLGPPAGALGVKPGDRHPVLRLADALSECVGQMASDNRKWIVLASKIQALQNCRLGLFKLKKVGKRSSAARWTVDRREPV